MSVPILSRHLFGCELCGAGHALFSSASFPESRLGSPSPHASNVQREEVRVSQESLQKSQGPVEQCAAWAAGLVRAFGGGEAGIAAAARKAGVPKSRVWSLTYRPQTLKDIGAKVYFALRDAYEAECRRQQKALENELRILEAAGAGSSLSRAAARLGSLEIQPKNEGN